MKRKNNWIYTVFFITFCTSTLFGALANSAVNNLNIIIAILILLLIIIVNILFDIIGMAVASTNEAPFHAKASRKHKGAKEAISLVKNADKVSNICNDVVGDICGIISGSIGALLSVKLSSLFNIDITLISLIMGAIIASLTVVGKALGKSYAIDNSTNIIYKTGAFIHLINRKKNNKQKKNS
jgi:CBS domain containing-hemolysin-like protein